MLVGSAEGLRFNESWERAREIISHFEPSPPIIRQVTKLAIGRADRINELLDGSVIGFKKLILDAAADKILGTGQKGAVSSLRQALELIPSDVVAALLIIHGVSRKLRGYPNERIWRTFFDEAMMRAAMGYYVGQVTEGFGSGRAMLAAFAGRAGLALLCALGGPEEAKLLLEGLSTGGSIDSTCMSVYRCDPLHVGGMMLLAAGCGTGSCMGLAAASSLSEELPPSEQPQVSWYSTHIAVDMMSSQQFDNIPSELWSLLGFEEVVDRQDLCELVKVTVRKGNPWKWLV
jgi:hypothetical protein